MFEKSKQSNSIWLKCFRSWSFSCNATGQALAANTRSSWLQGARKTFGLTLIPLLEKYMLYGLISVVQCVVSTLMLMAGLWLRAWSRGVDFTLILLLKEHWKEMRLNKQKGWNSMDLLDKTTYISHIYCTWPCLDATATRLANETSSCLAKCLIWCDQSHSNWRPGPLKCARK